MADKPIFELGVQPGELGLPNNSIDKSLGHYLCIGPPNPPYVEEIQNRYSNLNFTGPPGSASSIYFSLVYQLPKWEWFVAKMDEWIEVPPTHKEYYERTMTSKQMLESTIKTGLTSAAQAVADFELLNHDLRKYKEILTYFQSKDENVLKSMFIDQVDIHTDLPGQPIALRSDVGRWPTIIADFMKLKDEDVEPNKIAEKLDISKAEAVILATKNRLYKQWKELFGGAAKQRYETISSLVSSRKTSIREYKEWLKPYIARFKMTRLGGERPNIRGDTLRTYLDVTGMSTFTNNIRLMAWKQMRFEEHRKPAAEISGKFMIHPYDDYIREHLILDPDIGLSKIYPWLRNDRKFCPKCKRYYSAAVEKCEECGSTRLKNKKYADEIVETEILPKWNHKLNLNPQQLYYMVLDFNITRVGVRTQAGENEDIVFYTKVFVLSQNAMLVKLLELKCRDMELERYIDEMLGVRFDDKEISDIVKEEFPGLFGKPKGLSEGESYIKGLRDTFQPYTDLLGKIKLPKTEKLLFVKAGPYERDLIERITKHFLKFAAGHLALVSNFLKQKMGIE